MKTILLASLLLISFHINAQGWVFQNSGVTTTLRQVVFYNAQTGWTVGDGGKILKSTNGGGSWNLLNSGTTQDLYSIVISDSITLLACGASGVIIKTTNGGASWAQQTSGTTNTLRFVYKWIGGGGVFFVCGNNGTYLSSANYGSTWMPQNVNTTQQLNCIYFVNEPTGFVFGNNGTILEDGIQIPFHPTENILACTRSYPPPGAAICTNAGNIYKNFGPPAINSGVNTPLNSMDSKGLTNYNTLLPKMWCAGDNGVIRYSSDTGHTWTGQNISSTVNITSIFMLDSLRGWIVGSNGLISGTTSGGVIGIQPISTEIPKVFSLSQNYPNPFNPNSKIKFQIAKLSDAKLVVFDVLGREVSTLVNEQLKPGTYEVDFDGSKFTSGVYFYKLVTDGFLETKKMVLVK